MNPYLQLLLGLGLDYGIDRLREYQRPAPTMPPAPTPTPQMTTPIDVVDFLEHLENERAASDCGCEDY